MAYASSTSVGLETWKALNVTHKWQDARFSHSNLEVAFLETWGLQSHIYCNHSVVK